jgi:hypothetical protein
LTVVRVLAVTLLVALAGIVGVCATFVHASRVDVLGRAVPAGLLIAVSGTAAVLVLGHRVARTRWGTAAVAAGWLLPVLLLSLPRPEGDVVVTEDRAGVTFVVTGVVLAGLAVGMPAGAGGFRDRAGGPTAPVA